MVKRKHCEAKSAGAIIRKGNKILLLNRAFFPLGWACPAGHIKKGEKPLSALAAVTEELGKTVFGGFISIEPGTSHVLTLEYYLSDQMAEQVKKGEYNLLVQKQLGASAYPLTLDLDFGKKTGQEADEKFYQKTDLATNFYVYQKDWH